MAKMQLLPIEILQEQVCSECLHYLTVLPISQHENGKILCGRTNCLKKNGTKSILNTLIKSFQFHCVNYLDGCQALLTSATSKNHENACKFPARDCFFCSYKGNWAQIRRHMKTDHSSKITEDCRFRFEVGEESSQNFVYFGGNYTCLVSVSTSREKLEVIISMVNSICDNDIIKQSKFMFCKYPYNFQNQDHVLIEYCCLNSISKNYFEKSMDELILCFNLGTVLTCEIIFDSHDLSEKELQLEKKDTWLKELMHDLSKQQKSLNNQNLEQLQQKHYQGQVSKVLRELMPRMLWCNVCNKPINDDVVYTCENKHIYCRNCMESESAKDNKVPVIFQKTEGLSKIHVTCEWVRCRKLIPVVNYLNHKSCCSQRLYKCPVSDCTVYVYSLKALEDHWHSDTSLIKADLQEIDQYGIYTCFWIINYDLYKLYVNFQQYYVMVDVESVSVVNNVKFSLHGWCPRYEQYYTNWKVEHNTTFCGKYIFIATNLANGYGVSKVKISLLE